MANNKSILAGTPVYLDNIGRISPATNRHSLRCFNCNRFTKYNQQGKSNCCNSSITGHSLIVGICLTDADPNGFAKVRLF
jgi:hypothetical protein